MNGTIDTNSLQILQGDNGQYSLNFGFASYDTGDYTLSRFGLPGYSPMSSLSGGFGFGSPNYAASLFSQVANNPAVQGVSTPRGIASFYAASAATGAAGLGLLRAGTQLAPLLQEYGPQALAQVDSLLQTSGSILQQIALDPRTWDFVNDVLSNYLPGPVPATIGGAVGFVVNNWEYLNQAGQKVYQEIKGSVPH